MKFVVILGGYDKGFYGIKEETKSSYYESSKREGDWDSSKSNNDEFPIWKNFKTYKVNILETGKLKVIWLKKDHHLS